VFDINGRHVRTVNTLTGATEYEFGRDGEGRLVNVADVDGDVTTIERDDKGKALAVVSPDGQRTELTVDDNGHLTAVVNPEGETYRMQYTDNGLLTEFRDRKNLPNTFEYDSLGRLTRDVNPGLGGWTLARSGSGSGYQTTLTTAEGREQRFSVQRQLTGERLQVNRGADDTLQTLRFNPNGRETATQPDGTQITLQKEPDPRFGMLSPVPASVSVTTPSGLTSNTITSPSVTLTDPADPLSLQSLTETVTLNGHAFNSVYDGATKNLHLHQSRRAHEQPSHKRTGPPRPHTDRRPCAGRFRV
jgi:YD repeat-containing protein